MKKVTDSKKTSNKEEEKHNLQEIKEPEPEQ